MLTLPQELRKILLSFCNPTAKVSLLLSNQELSTASPPSDTYFLFQQYRGSQLLTSVAYYCSLAVVKKFITDGFPANYIAIADSAIRANRPDTLEWALSNHQFSRRETEQLLTTAGLVDSVECAKLILAADSGIDQTDISYVIIDTAGAGSRNVYEYLSSRHSVPADEYLLNPALIRGGLYEPNQEDVTNSTYSCASAISTGRLDMYKKLREAGYPASDDNMRLAATMGHWNLVDYLFSVENAPVDEHVIQACAASGDKKRFEWAYENFNGYLDLLRQIHENGWPIHPQSVREARIRGQTHIVEYLNGLN